MTELTLRDGMVIIGSLLILAVLVDAWRRMREQQRANVRLKLAKASDIPQTEPAEDLTVYRELPNGGARVIDRSGEPGYQNGAEARSRTSPGLGAADSSSTPAPSVGGVLPATSAKSSSRAADSVMRADEESAGSAGEGAKGKSARSKSKLAKAGAASAKTNAKTNAKANAKANAKTNAKTSAKTSAKTNAKAGAKASLPDETSSNITEEDDLISGVRAHDEPANLDWLEDLPERPTDAEDDGGELPRDPQTEVIVLHVMSRQEEGFSGKDILEILLACDLRFGDMNFFHRHEQQAGRGAIQFSVANMLQPGVFDIDNMESMYTRGLVFFLTLPGPEDMSQAFDYMLETARVVSRNLSGDLLDESRSVLTSQSIEHSRQQIRELERRLLTSRA